MLPGQKEEGEKKKPSDTDVKLIHIHWFIIDHGAFHIDTKILYCKFYNNQVNSVQKHNNHDGGWGGVWTSTSPADGMWTSANLSKNIPNPTRSPAAPT